MKKRSAKKTTGEQVLMDHVQELRIRIFVCAIVLVIGGIIGYIFYEPILAWLRIPLGQDLYYSSPAGSFNFIIKVSSMVGVLAAVPFLFYQLIMFVQPVFAKKLSIKRVIFYTSGSVMLAMVGALFAFFVILPGALKFFAGFQVPGLSALIDADSYLNFVTNAIVTFIIVFQIPLLMIIIDRIKPISPKKLFSMEKYVILGGLVVSLFVPFALDITTSLLIASPIIVLYNISVVMILIRHAVMRKSPEVMPIAVTQTAEEIALDDALVSDFFAAKAEHVPELQLQSIPDPTPIQSVMKQSSVPAMDVKPSRPVDAEQLRAQARLRREQQIAERVALYNTLPRFRTMTDIR
ncbi:twin-arginine translocase subunit TatC [Candidatus Saccharibacteria bacterium]|nr:twin-arginine translocase subunit TatC [Candidatus Saccharibacteria bacterium]